MIARAGAVALACTLLALAAAPVWASAAATNISDAQLRSLAAQAAAGDPAALAGLRSVGAVDGEPADLGAALATSNHAELTSRLRTLAASASSPTAGGADAASAQAMAAGVLRQRRYGRAPLPDPIGTVFSKVGHFLSKLASRTPGGPVVFWLIVATIALVVAAVGARRMTHRLDAAARMRTDPATGGELDSRLIERRAEAAEARGAYAEAIRLRFQAGLLTLGERGRIVYRPSLLTGEARRELHSEAFDELAAGFEAVAYGHAGEDADAAQAAATRERWRELLQTGR